MKAIILCAGKGKRLRPLTENIPKPLVPINGKPALEYLIRLCKKHNINNIGINTSYLPEKIKEHFGDGSNLGVKMKYSYEPELLGTAGALNNFRDFFDETFFVIYGDNITDLDLSKMLEFHKSKNALATLYLYRESVVDNKTTPGQVVLGKNNKIEQIIENPNEDQKAQLEKIPYEKKLTNTGVYILEPEILNIIPHGFSDFPTNIFQKLIKTNRIFGFQSECYFKEIGQMMRYNVAKKDIESGRIKLNI